MATGAMAATLTAVNVGYQFMALGALHADGETDLGMVRDDPGVELHGDSDRQLARDVLRHTAAIARFGVHAITYSSIGTMITLGVRRARRAHQPGGDARDGMPGAVRGDGAGPEPDAHQVDRRRVCARAMGKITGASARVLAVGQALSPIVVACLHDPLRWR